jgi:hypothetical protein
MKRFFEIWNRYPEHIKELDRRTQQEPVKTEMEEDFKELKKKISDALGKEWVTAHWEK